MEHYGFFDGDQYYGQEELARYFDKIYESGVSVDISGHMTMGVSVSDTNINIDPGFAIVQGFYLYNDSVKTIPITRDANHDRIDRVLIRLDLSSKSVSIEYKQGVAGSNPKPPNIQRDNIIYELSLAQVKVPKAGNIVVTDERYRRDLCGAIRPRNLTEFNDMIDGYQKEFNRWFAEQRGLGWRNIYIQEEEPTEITAGGLWWRITKQEQV